MCLRKEKIKVISKKDLLVKMNISYGQLYRWKREGLIPDEWFVKQSVPSGQETFFDENLIIPRIEQILEYKDKYQLDEMKDIFSNNNNINYNFKKALNLDIIDPYFLKIYLKDRHNVSITELAMIYILTEIDDEVDSIQYLKEDFSKLSKTDIVYIIEADDESYVLVSNELKLIDKNIKIKKIYKIEDAVLKIASLI